ncbi:MAG: hypothetical protein R2720_14565 [Candidatus Nanopelagicales bacterium]
MSKKISRVDKYAASPEAIWAMLCESAYVEGQVPGARGHLDRCAGARAR